MSEQQPQHKTKDDRIYYGLLVRVGTNGMYQRLLIVLLCTISILSASNFFVNPYLFYQDPYLCPDLSTKDCSKFVCSLPVELRAAYLPEERMQTMGNAFGDLHCQRMSESKAMQQFILIGASIGLVFSIIFSGIAGRKNMVLISLSLSIIGVILTLTAATPKLACIGLFLWGAGAETSFSLIYNFATELTAEKDRANNCTILMVFFVLGSMGNTFFFYVFRNWRLVLVFFYLLTNVVVCFAFAYFVESTPIELIERNTPAQALNAFLRIAKLNSVTDHGLSLEQIDELQQEYKYNQYEHQHDNNFTILDLFRYPSVRRDFIPMCIFYFVMMFEFYGPSLLMEQIKMDLFVDGLVNGISQLLTFPILFIIATDYPRRKWLTIFFICATLFCLTNYLMTSKDCLNCNSSIGKGINLAVFFIFRFFIYLPTNFFMNSLNETLPAQVRVIGIYTIIGVGRISTLIIPFLTEFGDWLGVPLMLIFVVGSLLCVVASLFIRETVHIPPPEIIEELTMKKHDYKYHKEPQ